jgi:hypothetical protein
MGGDVRMPTTLIHDRARDGPARVLELRASGVNTPYDLMSSANDRLSSRHVPSTSLAAIPAKPPSIRPSGYSVNVSNSPSSLVCMQVMSRYWTKLFSEDFFRLGTVCFFGQSSPHLHVPTLQVASHPTAIYNRGVPRRAVVV